MSNDVNLIDLCDEFVSFRDSLSFFCEVSSCLLEKSLEDELDTSVVVGLWRFGCGLRSEMERLQGLLDSVRNREG